MHLRFITSRLCPFAQRNLIVMHAKKLDFEVVWVDLFDKPAWLFELNDAGKVPLLEVDGELLAESTVINEFLEEVFVGARLHPESALERARSRMWIEAVSPLNLEVHRIMMAPDDGTSAEAVETARQRLCRLEPRITGPLFSGAQLDLVDVTAAPALIRLAWCAAIDPETNAAAGLERVEAWQRNLVSHEAVMASTPDGLHALWLEFLKGGASPKRTAPATRLGIKASVDLTPAAT
ncbi:MAG: glutathione S-transferase [Sorangiineae bacterium PRO1]|nr:glutathione S-transferase [Sorangiineae bacterium PRO1]